MTPLDRSAKALEGVNIRKVLEESNLPVEIAVGIADEIAVLRQKLAACYEQAKDSYEQGYKAHERLAPEDGGITQALVQMARDNAIEECAALCDETAQLQSEMAQSSEEESMVTYRKARAWDASVCAANIRALKQSTPQNNERGDK